MVFRSDSAGVDAGKLKAVAMRTSSLLLDPVTNLTIAGFRLEVNTSRLHAPRGKREVATAYIVRQRHFVRNSIQIRHMHINTPSNLSEIADAD